MSTAANIRSSEKYNKAKTKQYCFRFFTEVVDGKGANDLLVIERLDTVENKTDYVRQLILKDIENDRD